MSALRHEHLDRTAMLLMVVLCSIWGIQQVTIKLANTGLSPVWQAGMRSLLATGLVFAWARQRGVDLRLNDGTLAPGLLAGSLFAGEFALLYWALEFTTAARGVIFLYTAPFFVSLGAIWLLPAERLRPSQWGGLGLAFCGVLSMFGENLMQPAGRAWVGDLMVLAAAVLWAATTLTVKASRLASAPIEKALLYQLAVSGPLLMGVSWLLGEPGVFNPSPLVWACFAFQVLVVAGLSYMGWFWLIRHYPATRLSAFSFLTPLMGVLAGGLLLGEPITPAVLVGLLLVGTGIVLANRPVRRPS